MQHPGFFHRAGPFSLKDIAAASGAIVIGAILYGIVLWTNARFAEHHKAEKKASISVVAPTVV